MWSPLGLVQGPLQYGMVDTSPLRNFLSNYIHDKGVTYHRKAAFSAVNANNGNYEIFNETLSEADKVNAVMSTSAIPFAFPSQHWQFNGAQLNAIDGGSVWNINIASAINRCKEVVGDDESKITVDIIDCGTSKQSDYSGEEASNTINNYLRYMNLKSYNEDSSDVGELMAAFPDVNFRHYVNPSQALGTMAVMDGTNNTCTFPMQ